MTEPSLDLRTFPETEWITRFGSAFETLPAAESLLVITAGDPRSFIRQLIRDYWGQFFWAPLSEGNGERHSILSKRDQPGANSILEMLSHDHRRCDLLFADAEAAAAKGDLEKTTELFKQLELGMERHFTMEEEGFFPEFDRRMGFMESGPAAVMREEHQQMRGMLGRMAGVMDDSNLDEYLAASETMLYLMEQHNMKEEQMLYPMAEDAFSADMEQLLKNLYLY